MSPDGWMWLVIDVVAVVALGGALFYGITQRKKRSTRAMEQAGKQPDS